MQGLMLAGVLTPSIPFLVVFIAGMVFAGQRLGAYPSAKRYAQIGLGVLVLRTMVTAASEMMAVNASVHAGSAMDLARKFLLINIVNYLLLLGGIVLLVMAAFADRKPASAAQ